MLLLRIGVEATQVSELRAPSQLLGLELEEHVGGRMLGIGRQPVQVNLHRSVIRTRLDQQLEFRPRRRDVARPNLGQHVVEVAIENRVDTVVFTSGDVNDRHVELFSFDLDQTEFSRDVAAGGFGIGLTTDQQVDLEMSSQCLQPRGKVDRIADA